jgi:hypothetical protein
MFAALTLGHRGDVKTSEISKSCGVWRLRSFLDCPNGNLWQRGALWPRADGQDVASASTLNCRLGASWSVGQAHTDKLLTHSVLPVPAEATTISSQKVPALGGRIGKPV